MSGNSVERRAEQRGVWTVDGQTAVTERARDFFTSAEEEIIYRPVEDLLIEGSGEAAERGVSNQLAGVSSGDQDRTQEAIPGAMIFESLWVWSDTPAGRIMMVDGRKTLVSALVNGEHPDPSNPQSETAIWGAGDSNSLMVMLNANFTWRLDTTESDD